MSKKLFFSKKYIFLQNLLYHSIPVYLSEKNNQTFEKFNNFVIKSERYLSLHSEAVQLAPSKAGGWKKKKRLQLYANSKKIKKNLYKNSFKLFNSDFHKNSNLISSEVKKNSLLMNFFNLKNLNYNQKIKLQNIKNEKKFINSNKFLNISNQNLPYKKSFFCYWLLPFLGFVSYFTTINSYIFLTSNEFNKNGLNNFFLLQSIGIKLENYGINKNNNFQYNLLNSSLNKRKIDKNLTLSINSANISYLQSFSKNLTINDNNFKNSSFNYYSKKKVTSNSFKILIKKLYEFYYKDLEKSIINPEHQNSQGFNNFFDILNNFYFNNLNIKTRNYLPFFYNNSMVPLNNLKIKESIFKAIWLDSSLNIYFLSNQSKLKINKLFSNSKKKVFKLSFKKSLHSFSPQLSNPGYAGVRRARFICPNQAPSSWGLIWANAVQLAPSSFPSEARKKAEDWSFLNITNKDFLLPKSNLKKINNFNSFPNSEYFIFGQKLEKDTYSILNNLKFIPSFYKYSTNLDKNCNIKNLSFLLEIDKNLYLLNSSNKQIYKNPILSLQTASILLDRLINPTFVNKLDNWISQNLVEQRKAFLLNFQKSSSLNLSKVIKNKIDFNRSNKTYKTKVLNNHIKLTLDELQVDKIFSSLSIFNFTNPKIDIFEFYNYKKNKINSKKSLNSKLWVDNNLKNSNIKKDKNLLENTIFFLIKKKILRTQNKNFQRRKGTWFKIPFIKNQLVNTNKNIIFKKMSDSTLQFRFIPNFYKTKKIYLFVNDEINVKLKLNKLRNRIKLVQRNLYKPLFANSSLDIENGLFTSTINTFSNSNKKKIHLDRENLLNLNKFNKDSLYYLMCHSFKDSFEITENFIQKKSSLYKLRPYKDNIQIPKFGSLTQRSWRLPKLLFKKVIKKNFNFNNVKPINCIKIYKNKLLNNKPLGWLTYFNNLINLPIYNQRFTFFKNIKTSSPSIAALCKVTPATPPALLGVTLGLQSCAKNNFSIIKLSNPIWITYLNSSKNFKNIQPPAKLGASCTALHSRAMQGYPSVTQTKFGLRAGVTKLCKEKKNLFLDFLFVKKIFHKKERKSYLLNSKYYLKAQHSEAMQGEFSLPSKAKLCKFENKLWKTKKKRYLFLQSLSLPVSLQLKENSTIIQNNEPNPNPIYHIPLFENKITKKKKDNSLSSQSKLIKENLTKKLIQNKEPNPIYPISFNEKTRMILDLNLPIDKSLTTQIKDLKKITNFSKYINFLFTKIKKIWLNPSNIESQKKMKKNKFSKKFLYLSNAKINFIKINNDKAFDLNKFDKFFAPRCNPQHSSAMQTPAPWFSLPSIEKRCKVEQTSFGSGFVPQRSWGLPAPAMLGAHFQISKVLDRSSWYASLSVIPVNKENFHLKLPKSMYIFSGLNKKIIKFRNYRYFSKPKTSLLFHKNNSKVYSQAILKNLIQLNKNKSFCLQNFSKFEILNKKNKLINNGNSLDSTFINLGYSKKYLIKRNLKFKTKPKLKKKKFNSFKSLKLEKIFRSYLSKKIHRSNFFVQSKNKNFFLKDTLNSSLCFKSFKHLKIKLLNKLILKSQFFVQNIKEIRVLRLIKNFQNIKLLDNNNLISPSHLNKKFVIKTRKKMNSKVKNFFSPNLLFKNRVFRKKRYGKINMLPYSSEKCIYLLDKLTTLNIVNPWRLLSNNKTFFINNRSEYRESLATPQLSWGSKDKVKINKDYKYPLKKNLSENFYYEINNKFKNLYENSIDLTLNNLKNNGFSPYLSSLDRRKYQTKKHRKKKQRKHTRLRKKRKRSSPRPVWFRYNLYTNFLKLRHFEREKTLTIKRQNSRKVFFSNPKFVNFYSNFTSTEKSNLKYESFIDTHEVKNIYKTTNLHLLRQKIYRNYQQKWLKMNLKTNDLTHSGVKNQETIFPEFLDNKNKLIASLNSRYFSFFANNNFYVISKNILSDLKRLFWKSYWLRSNLSPYLNRVKHYLAEMKKSTKNYHLNLNIKNFLIEITFGLNSSKREIQNQEDFWTFSKQLKKAFPYKGMISNTINLDPPAKLRGKRSLTSWGGISELCWRNGWIPMMENERGRNSCNFKKNPNNLELYGNINIKNYLQNETYFKSTLKWQTATNLTEYQRIIFQRIQQTILNIRENLKLNGQPKARPSKIGYQKLPTPKSIKEFWVKFGKAIPLKIQNNCPINFYGDISKLRTMWTLNKSNLACFKASNKRKNVWINNKLREQRKSNKTKKIISQMNTKLTNLLNEKYIMTDKENKLSNLNLSETLTIKPFFNRFISNNLSIDFSPENMCESDKTNPNQLDSKTLLEEKINALEDIDYTRGIEKFKRSLEIFESKLRKKENKLSYLGFLNKKTNKLPLKKYELRELKKQLCRAIQNLQPPYLHSVSLCKATPATPPAFSSSRRKFKMKTSFLSEAFILKNRKSLKINLVKPTYLNLTFFNKFTTEYNYWWNSFSLQLIPQFKNMGNSKINKNHIRNFYPNDLIIWISTFLFHFCALLFLINAAEIRELIKFNIILFSNIFKTYLEISFKVCYPLFENPFNNTNYKDNYNNFIQTLKSLISIKNKNIKQFYLKYNTINLKTSSKEISFSRPNLKLYRNIQFFLYSKKEILDQLKQKSLHVMLDPNKVSISNKLKVNSKNKIKTYNINFFSELIYLSFLYILTKILLHKNKQNLLIFNKKILSSKVQTDLFHVQPSLSNQVFDSLNYSKDSLNTLREKENFYINEYKLFDKKFGLLPTSLIVHLKNKDLIKIILYIKKKTFPLTKYYLVNLFKLALSLPSKGSSLIYTFFVINLDIFHFLIGCIYLFFERPGELISEWIAYAFLVQWSSDLITTIPDVVDSSRMHSFLKISRGVRPFLITNPFYGNPTLNNSFLFSLNLLVSWSGLIQRRMLHIYETIIEKFYQPENDLITRQKKGIIFWDLWSEVLIEVAEDANINISELTSLKEEQNRLLEKLEGYGLQDSQVSIINIKFNNKNSRIISTSLEQHTTQFSLPSIAKLCKVALAKLGAHFQAKLGNKQSLENQKRGYSSEAKITKLSPEVNQPRNVNKNFYFIPRKPYYLLQNKYFDHSTYKNEKIQDFTFSSSSKKSLALINQTRVIDKKFENQLQRNWSVDQFVSYQRKDTELFIQKSPSKSFSHIPSIKYSQSAIQPIGTIVCQIFSGLFTQQIAKNILVVGSSANPSFARVAGQHSSAMQPPIPPASNSSSFKPHSEARGNSSETRVENFKNPNKFKRSLKTNRVDGARVGGIKNETLFIQAIAGETELKIITDNAHRYSMIYSGVAIGIKLLKDVFEALSFQTPCIFLLEDIHHIGGRRPFLISDPTELGQGPEFGSEKEEIHEKNQVIYELSKHLISHYKKPYKGDSSILIPTNHFCFNLFLGVSSPQIRNNLIPLSNSLNSNNSNEIRDLSSNLKDQSQSRPSEQIDGESKNNILSTSLLIKSNNLLAPPATSPFSVLLLKEDTKLNAKQVVKEIPWAGFTAEKLALISKSNYSIRVKIALLADMALSNLSVKLDMITDLLVIIDSVQANRGFIIFATTHIPYILDPALRRPGRFDETILLPLIPNLFSRWEILKTNLQNLTKSLPYSSFSRGLSIDFTNISGIFTSTADLSKFSQKFLTFNTKLKFQQSGSITLRNTFKNDGIISNYVTLTYHLSNKREQFIYPFQIKNYLFKKNIQILNTNLTIKKIFTSIKNFITLRNQNRKNYSSKIFFNMVARTYFYVSQILTHFSLQENYSPKVSSIFIHPKLKDKLPYSNSALNQEILKLKFSKKTGQKYFDTKLKKKEEKNFTFTMPPTDFFLFDSSIYLSLYTSKKTLKKYLTHLMSGKLGELFIFSTSSNNYKPNLKFHSKTNHFIANTGLMNLYGIDKTWQSATSLLFSLITKRYIYNKNLIIPKLLYFSNYSPLHETPTAPASNILLPLKRYENYRKTFYTEQIKNKANFQGKTLQVILELHQQQRFIKRLYKLPLREFFRSEIINEKLTGFSNSLIMLSPVEKTINFSTNINWYYRNRILNRHRNYLNNQWWNGQLTEHNVESTFLSDLDGRHRFVKSIGEILMDFPDSDKFYHVKNRRWLLTSNSWENWFSFEKTSLDTIFNQYMFDCFTQAYNSLDHYREILDFYAFTSLNECMLKEFKEITIINLFKRLSNSN